VRALLVCHDPVMYRLTIGSVDDIAEEIRERHLETIPAGRFDFWVTPSLRPASQRLNQRATKILLGASTFTARQVPLLRGTVVVTGRGQDGQLGSLSDEEITWLADFVYALPCRSDWVVD
jgi:hypothetical protein